jgi:hypothetical protein
MREIGINQPLTYTRRVNGRIIPPDTCGCIIYDRSRTIIASGNASILDSGICSFEHEIDVYGDYLVEWNFTAGTQNGTCHEMWSLVKSPLQPVISDIDLFAECAALEESHYYHRGEVAVSEEGQFTDNALLGSQVNYDGAVIEFLSGNYDGTSFIVESFIGVSGIIRITALSEPVEPGSVYLLQKPFQAEMQLAFDEICHKVTQQSDYRPALIVSPDDFRFVHIYLSLDKICRGLSVSPDDIWMNRARHYAEQFEYSWKGLKFEYDYTKTIRSVTKHEGFLR